MATTSGKHPKEAHSLGAAAQETSVSAQDAKPVLEADLVEASGKDLS